MGPHWVCADCDERWPEEGTGGGFGRALSHTANTAKQLGQKHAIRGLVDLETGEVLVEGLSKPKAEAAGYIQPPPKAARAAEPADKDAPIRRGPKDAMAPSVVNTAKAGTVTGTVKGATIEFPVYMTAYWSMGMAKLLDPDTGNPYPATAEGLSKYVVDFMRLAHEAMLYKFLDMAAEVAASEQGQRQLQIFMQTVQGLSNDQVRAIVEQNLAKLAKEAS